MSVAAPNRRSISIDCILLTLAHPFQTLFDIIDILAIAIDQRIPRSREHHVSIQLYDAQGVAAANANRSLAVRLHGPRISA